MFTRNKIWKLQRPIFSNEPTPMVMAYTESRQNMAMIPMGEEIMDELFDGELKIYVLATVKNGILKVKQIIEDQDW